MINQEPYLSYRQAIDDYLKEIIDTSPCAEETLQKAMHYSVFNGGKRLRALLMYTLAKALCNTEFENYEKNALKLAASCELVHAYSLVHDDLPAMDNDDWRRGKPACHKQFNEATAILVGDALQSLAFFVLSTPFEHIAISQQLRFIGLLAQAIGHTGMAGGQALDLQSKSNSLESLVTMHRLKTGALFNFAIEATLIGIDFKDSHKAKILKQAGYHLGLAFQIQDDILDVESSSQTLGKPQFSDEIQGKSTFVTLLGLCDAKKQLVHHHQCINTCLDDLSLKETTFAQLIHHMQSRSY